MNEGYSEREIVEGESKSKGGWGNEETDDSGEIKGEGQNF